MSLAARLRLATQRPMILAARLRLATRDAVR